MSDLKVLLKTMIEMPCDLHVFDPTGTIIFDEDCDELIGGGYSVLVNLGFDVQEYKGLPIDEFDIVLNFGSITTNKPLNLHSSWMYRQEPQGSIRWIYRSGYLNDSLHFYNVLNKRSRWIKRAIQLAHALGFDGLASSGSFEVYSKVQIKLDSYSSKTQNRLAIFTGTPGTERTPLIAIISNNRVSSYVKVALNDYSFDAANTELQASRFLALNHITEFDFPEVKCLSKTEVQISNVKEKSSHRPVDFNDAQEAVVRSFFKMKMKVTDFNHSQMVSQYKEYIWKAMFNKKNDIHSLARQTLCLLESINEREVILHPAHGDFTPWNMFESQNRAQVFDWEKFMLSAPALYDVFHFHYQKGILSDRKSLKDIRLDLAQSLKRFKDIESVLQLNFKTYEKLYLVHTISHSLNLYSQQELTDQNKWQISTWLRAVNMLLVDTEASENMRKGFIKKVNNSLQLFPHAFLKCDVESLDYLNEYSDLDIAMSRDVMNQLIAFLDADVNIEKRRVFSKSFMTTVEFYFTDHTFLSIDFIHQFMRKDLMMLDINELLGNAEWDTIGQIWRPALKHDLTYALSFYTLNNAQIPFKYFRFFNRAQESQKKEAIEYINSRFKTEFSSLAQMFLQNHQLKEKLQTSMRASPLVALKFQINYLIDTLKGIYQRKGFMVTFSGVDGAGKSTIIQLVKNQMEKNYRKEVVLLRHRPGILPILSAWKHGGKQQAEKIAGETMPRQGNNKLLVSSILRFGYYYTDYLIGQFIVYLKYVMRGKIVLYDRYYFDFINDAKRSNIELNPSIAKALYTFVFKPRLNFFLYAKPSVILSRKQELKEEDIYELTNRYRSLFQNLQKGSKTNQYKTIENVDLEQTMSAIIENLQKVS